ncbi:centrosomal protein of 162 kDa isoform X1 [Perognathus longimembris pacificus]|uniref:centrosomal protein of 162 kDa isoform X1 n=1 Tax=Perognathus longimembris pacificus TaxID=214514 RepID=UPI00201A0C13|nr:centrosomal protein of 162 kDa isoform X1 [Perognathus longimembris pacificus]
MAHSPQEELDEEFEQFMKELSDDSFENINKMPKQPAEERKKKDTVPWWITGDDFEDDGLLGANVSYLKLKTSQPIVETEEESPENIKFLKSSGTSVLSVDSLEANEAVVSDLHHSVFGLGLDTLEEQEEKEQFFARLEKGLTSSIDYSRLNKELDSNDSTQLKAFQSYHANIQQTEEEHKSELKQEELPESYSDDFEDIENNEVPLMSKDEETYSEENLQMERLDVPNQKEEKIGMLANVVLLDSLESVEEANSDRRDKATPQALPEATDNEMTATGVSHRQSNSDIEALHQAYCHVAHSLGDTEEQAVESNTIENTKSSAKDHPQENEESSKHISTTESDLPTVEELMKPIRIDSCGARVFDLQSVSSKKVADSRESEYVTSLPLKMNTNIVSQDPSHANQLFEKNDEIMTLQKKTNGNTENSSPTVTNMKEHVDNIDKMYLHILRKKISVNSSLSQDGKTHKAFRSQLTSEEGAIIGKQILYKKARSAPPLLKRKPQSGLFTSVRSSGYGKPNSPLKFSTFEKKTSKDVVKSKNLRSIPTSNQARKKEILSGTKVIKPTAVNRSIPKRENCLATPKKHEDLTATESYVQFQTDSLGYCCGNKEKELFMFERVQEAEEKWRSAQALIEQIKITFSEKEKELENQLEELKLQQEKELFKLNQENYILQAKLSSLEETSRKQRWLQFGETADPVTEEKLKQIQKEIEEQETLLQGYQQENERLYNQVKDLQEQNKKNKEQMFKENQTLFSELASLKEQMHKCHLLSQVPENSEPARNQSFTDLLAELRGEQKEKSNLLEEIKRLKQDKQALEVDLEKMKKERDQAKDQIAYTTGEKLYEINLLEETHKQEVSCLQKRLQWYAENQELLDKDTIRLKEANEEIEKLQLEIEKLKAEFGTPSTQQKLHSKDRAVDAKRIQDLERQVKEMEGILKRRYPNSLPTLILAASAAGDVVGRNTVEFMEKRVKKLEAELEGKDEEAKRSLRTMEQQFQKMKIQYEKRLAEQEQLLANKLKEEPQNHHDTRVKELETELKDIKEAHLTTVRNLETEIDILKQRNAELKYKTNDSNGKDLQSIELQVEQAHAKAKLVRLNEELAAKGREIQGLSRTVERLQKERRMMLSSQNLKGKEESSSRVKKDTLPPNRGTAKYFLEPLSGKLYQPHIFTDSHISEVLQENYRLKNELEGLIMERNKLKIESEAAVSQFENSMKRVKEDTAAHIASLKASHQREIEKLLCQNAVENSSSKVAELNRKIATQEVLIKHFQNQINELQNKQESLAVSQVREEILQNEVTKLLEELREAKESHTPEMKHFMGLEKKITQMEIRHKQREQELQQIIQKTHQVVENEQNKEVEKWKRLAQLKNRELDTFRTELDSILDVLRELHRQGVVVPVAIADEVNAPEFY